MKRKLFLLVLGALVTGSAVAQDAWHDCGWTSHASLIHAAEGTGTCRNFTHLENGIPQNQSFFGECAMGGGSGSARWGSNVGCHGSQGCTATGTAVCPDGTRHSYSISCAGAGAWIETDVSSATCQTTGGTTIGCGCGASGTEWNCIALP